MKDFLSCERVLYSVLERKSENKIAYFVMYEMVVVLIKKRKRKRKRKRNDGGVDEEMMMRMVVYGK